MSASLINDFADSRKQARIFKQRLPDLNAVLIELTRFPHQPCRMGESSNGNRSVIRCHTAKLMICDECGMCTQISSS
jgi:hypothetical protein